MSWEAPGYVAQELLGFGASGEVWRGRDTTTGEVVALKRLRVGRAAAEHDGLRREAALLSAFHHPHVVRLRVALCTRDGLVLVLDHAAGGSLGHLLARRGCLPPGQVAALLAPIGHALAAAHAVGLVHGDISGGNILLDEAGRPLLADLGTARLLGEAGAQVSGTPGFLDPAAAGGRPLTPRSDVYALGALAVITMAGPAAAADPAGAAQTLVGPQPLVRLLQQMLALDPTARPSAAEVAEQMDRCAEGPFVADGLAPEGVSSLALTHAAQLADQPAEPGRHRSAGAGAPRAQGRRIALRVGAAVLALLAAAVIGFRWGGGQPGQQPARAVVVPKQSWAQVWAGLDARRANAFAEADATLLNQVYLPDCPALPTDLRAVRNLATQQRHAIGVRHQISSLVLESAKGDTATLLVVDRMSGYQVRDGADHLVAQALPRGDRRLRARLVRTEQGWRIAALAAG